MCNKKCGLCRTKKQHYDIGDLVQIKVGSKEERERYINGIVTKRHNDRVVHVRYNIGDKSVEVKMIEKYLFCLNKNKCPIV